MQLFCEPIRGRECLKRESEVSENSLRFPVLRTGR